MTKVEAKTENVSETKRVIEIPRSIGVRQMAELLQVTPIEIIKQLLRASIMANINQIIEYEVAAAVATALGFEPHQKSRAKGAATDTVQEMKKRQGDDPLPQVAPDRLAQHRFIAGVVKDIVHDLESDPEVAAVILHSLDCVLGSTAQDSP